MAHHYHPSPMVAALAGQVSAQFVTMSGYPPLVMMVMIVFV